MYALPELVYAARHGAFQNPTWVKAWAIVGLVFLLTALGGFVPFFLDEPPEEASALLRLGLGAEVMIKGITSAGAEALRPPSPRGA